jgi:hypothetical protein
MSAVYKEIEPRELRSAVSGSFGATVYDTKWGNPIKQFTTVSRFQTYLAEHGFTLTRSAAWHQIVRGRSGAEYGAVMCEHEYVNAQGHWTIATFNSKSKSK